MDLNRFPRVRFSRSATPLEFMPNLSAHLGGPSIWIKRDDCTGLATGGNKVRKLEFLMGEAQRLGADHVVTQGAVQSNHVRQTAAAAAVLGMKCTGLIEHRLTTNSSQYLNSGNVFLDRLLGAELKEYSGGTDMNAALDEVAAELRANGAEPYVIPGGGSNKIGALGYVSCAVELASQAREAFLQPDCIVHATGSTGTQAGLVAGLAAINSEIRVLGISVRAGKKKQEENVYRLVEETAAYLGLRRPVPREAVEANADYVGEGYGIPTPEAIEAITLTARLEGILLDPVYSGKAMAGLIDLARSGHFNHSDTIVFLHTGGAVGLFGYVDAFEVARRRDA